MADLTDTLLIPGGDRPGSMPGWVTALFRVALACFPLPGFAEPATPAQAGICTLDIIFGEGFDVPGTLDLTAPGPFAVASVSGSSMQNSRVTPWVANYPVGASSAPVIVFVPGFLLASSLYQGWTAHLASWGYVAVRADPPTGFFDIDEPAMALDMRNVITDILSPAALPVTVDATRIAFSGHSLGGKVAFIAAGGDARIKSVFVFDPVNDGGSSGYTAGQPNIVPQPMGTIAVPTGILGELLDSTSAGVACAPAAINYQTLFSAETAAPIVYEWTLAGASHTSFVPDQAACGSICSLCNTPTLQPAETYAFMRSSAVAFLRTHLEGTPRLCPWLSGAKIPAYVSLRESSVP